jgi:hypothetical protein
MDGPSAGSLLRINLGPFNNSAQPVEKIDFVIHWNDNTWNNNSGQDFHILFTTTSVETGESLHTEYRLSQNYPNPFNPATEIGYELPAASDVRLSVFDLLGREVTLLVNTRQSAGRYTVRFDGAGLASGVYLYRLTAGNSVQMRKMALIR